MVDCTPTADIRTIGRIIILSHGERACYSPRGLNPVGSSIATRGVHPGRVQQRQHARLRWSLVRR
jgi:hypothetical protein